MQTVRGYSLPGKNLAYPDWHKALSQTCHWCHSLSLRMKSLRRTTIHTIRKDCGKAKGRRIRDSSMHRELHKLLGGRENRKIFTVRQPRKKDMGTDPSGRFLEKENVVWHIVYDPLPFIASPNGSLVKSFCSLLHWEVYFLWATGKKSQCYHREKPEATNGRESTQFLSQKTKGIFYAARKWTGFVVINI